MWLQHWLPADQVEKRDKQFTGQVRPLLGLPAGRLMGSQTPGLSPWGRQEEEAPKCRRGRQQGSAMERELGRKSGVRTLPISVWRRRVLKTTWLDTKPPNLTVLRKDGQLLLGPYQRWWGGDNDSPHLSKPMPPSLSSPETPPDSLLPS